MKKLVVLFFYTWLFADDSYWEGTIGKNKIYMELGCDTEKEISNGNSCASLRYFYGSHLIDIYLDAFDGKQKISKMAFAKEMYDNNISETLLLHYKENHIDGVWKSNTKKLDVHLKRLANLKNYEDFTHLREKFYRYKREKVAKIKDNKELVLIREKHSKSLLFRLGNGFLTQTRNAINPVLDNIQKEASTFILECTGLNTYGSGVEIWEGNIVYLSKYLLGYEEKASYDCGGAHPDFYIRHKLYDLHTGKRYYLEDLIRLNKDIPQRDGDNWEDYIDFRAKKLRDLAFETKHIPLVPNNKREELEGYDPYDLIYWRYIDWSYEKDGIRIYLDFPSYLRCYRVEIDESYLIPFTLFKKYKNSHFPYIFGE